MEQPNGVSSHGQDVPNGSLGRNVLFVLVCVFAIVIVVWVGGWRSLGLNTLVISVLLSGISSIFFPMQTRRTFLLLFGQIEYVDELSPKLEFRVRSRYPLEIAELNSLGFSPLFYVGQTFPILRILLVYPAVILAVMALKREVIGIYQRRRFLIGHPVLASEDGTTYAQILGLGVMLSTGFRNGDVLISCNYGNDNFSWKNYTRRAYSGRSIAETWQEHRRAIQLSEIKGSSADREMSFEKFVNMVG